MTTLICACFVFTLFITAAIIYLYHLHFESRKRKKKKKKEKKAENVEPKILSARLTQLTAIDWRVRGLLVMAILLVIFSMMAPFLFTRKAATPDFNFMLMGQIGDTVGGLMNPFIALAGVIVTGLAFYMQYRANFLQRALFEEEQRNNQKVLQDQINTQNKQIKEQQFESQFYEMLKLHRDNISEMKIDGYNFEEVEGGLKHYQRVTESRKVFVLMQTELEFILTYYKKFYGKLDHEGFGKCYELFFFGLTSFKKKYTTDQNFFKEMDTIRARHQYPDRYEIVKNIDRKVYDDDLKLYINYKPFAGHAQRLGHYFRHLFLAVKSVVRSEIIVEYSEKMRYLKLLRAQLSNHEQIMLFYNWMGEYGEPWENDKNQFFTNYCMIHNLWYKDLLQDSYISERVNELKIKLAPDRRHAMFEADES